MFFCHGAYVVRDGYHRAPHSFRIGRLAPERDGALRARGEVALPPLPLGRRYPRLGDRLEGRVSCDKRNVGAGVPRQVGDAYGLFKATRSAPGDAERIATLFRAYTEKTKYGIECGPMVGSLDIIRQRPVDSVGRMDGSVLGSIHLTYGERAGVAAKAARNTPQGGPTLFDASVGAKLTEIMAHFDRQLWKTRKRLKMANTVSTNLDPAGLNKKVDGGRMLDPTDPKAVEMMYDMLKGVCFGVWHPLKSLIGEELGASMEHPSAFLKISNQEAELLYEHAKNKGVLYSDVANICVLLALSNCFQRSQVMREATMNEFALVPDGTHFRHTFKDRTWKTATASASSGALPISRFEMSEDQSMMIHL
ncbi:unnamed protein product [Pylaiella littoralis]